MPKVQIQYRGVFKTRRIIARDLPESWKDVPADRRLRVLQALLSSPSEEVGRIKALKILLNVNLSVLKSMNADQISALLNTVPWLKYQPSAEPILEYFDHEGKRYFMPQAFGFNMRAMEYPIADEALERYLTGNQLEDLHLLCATICREGEPDEATVNLRGDIRIQLRSRAEAEARAKAFKKLPLPIAMAVLAFQAGLKEYIFKSYGTVLFKQPEEDGDEPQPEGFTLGWWGTFFDLATDGPFGNIEQVYQTSFHDICLYLVKRRKDQEAAEMRQKMHSPDWAQNADE